MDEKKPSKSKFENPGRVLIWEAILFVATLSLGVFNGYRFTQFLNVQPTEVGQTDLVSLIVYFIVGTLILVGLSSTNKFERTRGVIFKVLFLLAVGAGSLLIIQGLIPGIWGLLVVGALMAAWLQIRTVFIHDLLVMLGIAGAGSLLGLSFTPQLVVLLLIVFSIYDFIAVYKTKHMVKMAEAMVQAGSIVGLIVPSSVKDFTERVDQVAPGGRFLIVGGGDVVFPLILCVSFAPISMTKSLIMLLFSLLGLGFSFWVFTTQKIKKPIPALPPISVGAIIGYLVTLLI